MKDMETKQDSRANSSLNLTPEQEQDKFKILYPINPAEHLDGIKKYMRSLISGYKEPVFPDRYKTPIHRYTRDQVEAQEWQEEDYKDAIEHARKHEIASKYYSELAMRFESPSARKESVVRLDLEKSIFEDLKEGKPVIIRGTTRIGKSSMMYRMIEKFGKDSSIYIDAGRYAGADGNEKRAFVTYFGLGEVAEFIDKKETPENEQGSYDKRFERKHKIEAAIEKSGKEPFAYLNDWLEKRGETLFFGLDEALVFSKNLNTLKLVSDLKKYQNLRIAYVVHQVAGLEDSIKTIFKDYKQYYIPRLTDDEAKLMIAHDLETTGIQFTDDAIKELVEFSGGRPMDIHYVIGTLFDPYKPDYNPKLIYRLEDVERITKKAYGLPDVFEHNVIPGYVQTYEGRMNKKQQSVIKSLANDEKVKKGQFPQDVIQPLLDINAITFEPKTGEYKLNGTLFAKTMKEMHSSS